MANQELTVGRTLGVLLRRALCMQVAHARMANQEFTVAQNIRHAPSSRATKINTF